MLPTASSRSEAIATFSTSAAYRSLARRRSFRFLDLPSEIRNHIYEYVLENASRFVNLHHTGSNNVLACVPPLLAVNKQIREEFGSYYFGQGSFVILNSGLSIDSLGIWLEILGDLNRKRLANNGDVTIRFIFPWAEFTSGESRALRALLYARVMTLDDAAYLAGLSSQFERLTQEYPMMWHWQLQSQHRLDWYENSRRGRYVARELTEAIPVSFFERLRPALDRVFKQVGGKMVSARTADTTSETGWKWQPGAFGAVGGGRINYKVTTSSGGRIYLDARR